MMLVFVMTSAYATPRFCLCWLFTHKFTFHLFPSSAALVYEAVQRVLHPESVDGPIMFGTAAAGFAVNILMLSVLGHGHSHGGGHSHDGGHSHGEGHGHSHGGSKGGGRNIAVYAAFIHGTCCHTASRDPHPLTCCHFAVVGDLIQSVGVMIAAVVIWVKPEWHLADPICTFLFSVLVLFSTVNILRSSMGILMNSAPQHVDVPLLLHALQHISGVSNVHDLHVWTLSSQVTAMTVHLVADKPREALSHALRIAKKHGIQHPTVQVEKCGSSDVKACAENCSSCTLKVDLTDTEVKRIMQSCADDHGEAACSSGHGHSHSHSHGHGHSHGHNHGAGNKPTRYGTHSPSGEGQRCERLPDLCGDCGKTHLLVSPPQLAQLHEGPQACGGLIMRNPEVPSPTSGSAASSHDTREGLTVPESPTLEMRDMA